MPSSVPVNDAELAEAHSAERRAALRQRLVDETPRWYRPAVHLAVPSLFGLVAVAVTLTFVEDVRAWELLAVPVTYLAANATEWRVHRDLLHKRHPLAKPLYDQHTPKHHACYVTDDMAMRHPNEFRLVLLPAFACVLIFLVTVPPALLIGRWITPNVGALYLATCTGFVVSYEWLHLSYHLGPETWIGRRPLIAKLRAHHARHHDPRLMQRWNFNVTVPLWDWVRGTIWRM